MFAHSVVIIIHYFNGCNALVMSFFFVKAWVSQPSAVGPQNHNSRIEQSLSLVWLGGWQGDQGGGEWQRRGGGRQGCTLISFCFFFKIFWSEMSCPLKHCEFSWYSILIWNWKHSKNRETLSERHQYLADISSNDAENDIFAFMWRYCSFLQKIK